MCRPRVGVANPLFSLWRALRRPTAPASRTKSRRMAEESRTTIVLSALPRFTASDYLFVIFQNFPYIFHYKATN